MNQIGQVLKVALLVVLVEWPVRVFLFLFVEQYDYDGFPTMEDHRPSWTQRLQDWEDGHPEVVWLVAGLTILVTLVVIWASGHEDGLSHVGQSLKEAFWP